MQLEVFWPVSPATIPPTQAALVVRVHTQYTHPALSSTHYEKRTLTSSVLSCDFAAEFLDGPPHSSPPSSGDCLVFRLGALLCVWLLVLLLVFLQAAGSLQAPQELLVDRHGLPQSRGEDGEVAAECTHQAGLGVTLAGQPRGSALAQQAGRAEPVLTVQELGAPTTPVIGTITNPTLQFHFIQHGFFFNTSRTSGRR